MSGDVADVFKNWRALPRDSHSRFVLTQVIIVGIACCLAFFVIKFFAFEPRSIFQRLDQKMPGQLQEGKTERATFGMGCFWAGDSLFGVTPGVIRTSVGYAGGDKDSPTADHTEVVDVEYDPEIISYSQLLSLFWNNHEYGLTTRVKRQYMSLILWHDEDQKMLAEKSRDHKQRENGKHLITEIKKMKKFYPAEDYHQKYRLQGHPWLTETLGLTTGEMLRNSPLAAKLNGYLAGAGTLEQFEKDLPSLGLSDRSAQYLRKWMFLS